MIGYLLSMVQFNTDYRKAQGSLEHTIINFVPYGQDEQPLVDLMWQNAKIS
jgi:hypothetical protein